MKHFSNLLLCILLNANVYIFCSQNIQTNFNHTNRNTIYPNNATSILTFDQSEENNRNIVHAVMTRNIQNLTLLLDHGANPDTRNYYYGSDYFKRDTLLILAVKIGAFEIVEILLEKDANQKLCDNNNTIPKTPLSWCIEKEKDEECPEKKKEYAKILKLLREKK